MLTARTTLLFAFVLTFVAGGLAPANAQRYDNRNDREGRYDNDNGYGGGSSGRNVAGEFDYYALVLSWSPSHCASSEREDYEQCGRRDGRRYNFVLHGLWPQYERGFPGDCQIGRRPFVPDRVIADVIDVMPSKPLIIHEYRKHGTCSGMEPSRYFELGERLFRTIRIPKRYVNPFEDQTVSPETIIGEFLAENPQLKRDHIVVACSGSRNRLQDIRVCMTPKGEPRTCGKNENQHKLCRASSMFVPPVRSSSNARTDVPRGGNDNRNDDSRDDRGGNTGRDRPNNDNSPLPGPRMDRDQRSL